MSCHIIVNYGYVELYFQVSSTTTVETQTSMSFDDVDFITDAKAKKYNRKLFMREITKSDKSCMYYTGIPTVNVLKATFQ